MRDNTNGYTKMVSRHSREQLELSYDVNRRNTNIIVLTSAVTVTKSEKCSTIKTKFQEIKSTILLLTKFSQVKFTFLGSINIF